MPRFAFQYSSITVPFMVGEFDRIGYYKNSKGAQIASIPFIDENYEMVLILPPENTGTYTIFGILVEFRIPKW